MVAADPASGGGRGVPVGTVAAMSVGDYTTQVERCQAELVVELTKHADQMADILEKLVNCQIIEAEGWKLEEEAWNAAKAYRGFVGEC